LSKPFNNLTSSCVLQKSEKNEYRICNRKLFRNTGSAQPVARYNSKKTLQEFPSIYFRFTETHSYILKKRVSHAFWLILNWNRTEARLSWSSFSYCFIWCHRNNVNNSLSIHGEENILSSNFYLFMICLTTLSVEESVLLRPCAVSTIKYVSFKRQHYFHFFIWVAQIHGLLVLEGNETTILRSVGIYQSTRSNITEDLNLQ